MATPTQLLKRLNMEYPNAWANAEYVRLGKGQPDFTDWPAWCFLPFAAWYSILSSHFDVDRLSLDQIKDLSNLAAAGTWRYSKGIYRFAPEIFEAVYSTPPKGDMPAEILKRLPEWCSYIEVPPQLAGRYTWCDKPYSGFFVHLEEDANTRDEELRFLLLHADGVTSPSAVHIGAHTITEGVEKAVNVALGHHSELGLKLPDSSVRQELIETMAGEIYGLVSLTLYLCADEADISGPGPAQAKGGRAKLKKGRAPLMEAPKVKLYQVGETLARQIREAETRERGPVGERAAPRPHLRRGHWHHFWTGPRQPKEGQDRKLTVRFLMPTLVGGMGD